MVSIWFPAVESYYEDHHHDRYFLVRTCTLTVLGEKCSRLKEEVVYDWNNKVETYETVIAVEGKADNLHSNTDTEFTTSFTNQVADQYASSYSFQRTDGHDMSTR